MPEILRVVIDTNHIISAILSARGASAKLIDWMTRDEDYFQLLLSESIWQEYTKVADWLIPPSRHREKERIIHILRLQAVWIEPKIRLEVCAEKADNRFLECAVAGNADYLVTKNIRHFPSLVFLLIKLFFLKEKFGWECQDCSHQEIFERVGKTLVMKKAFIFPGQGSQRVGMGKSLAENYAVASRVFQEADEILGINLSQLCFEGPEEKLRRTEYTQIAVLTCSIAALRVLQEKGLSYDVVAGHSLGEYSALIACCSLSFEDGLKLVQHRATFMEEASQKQASGMIAVLNLDAPKLTAICEKVSSTNGVVQIANYNCPGQLVIAGDTQALEKAKALAESSKARCIPLHVNGAFHSSLMRSAAENLQKVIKDFSISKPEIKFIANVTGGYINKPEQIREILISQVTSPVQWEASVRLMINSGVTTFIEVGPGKVLSGLVRRIDGKVETLNVETSTDVEKVLEVLDDAKK